VLALFGAAAVLFTWPLAAHLRSRFPASPHPSGYNDTLLLAWVLSWDVHQLLRNPLALFDANIFHPLRHTLGYSEALVSNALVLLPLRPFTPSPVLLHNVALLLSFVLGGAGTFWLVHHLTGDRRAALVGGLVFAFAPYRFWQIDRLHALSVHWTPFLFLALHAYLEGGTRGRAAALAATFTAQALAGVYVAYASAVLVALYLLGWLLFPPIRVAGARARVVRAAGVLAAATAVVAVVLSPYAVVRDEMVIARDPSQVVLHSVPPAELGRSLAGLPDYVVAKLTRGVRGAGTLGLTGGALLAIGAVAGGRVGPLYGALALAALLFALGPVIVLPWGDGTWVPGPYRVLYEALPGFTALREPRRWMGMVVACGAIGAGLGAAVVLRFMRGRRGLVATGALVLLLVLEVGWRPLALEAAPDGAARQALYRMLATAPEAGAVAELPIGGDRAAAVATFWSAYHLRPLVNGYSGFRPTTAELRRRLRRFPSRRTVAFLRRLGVRFILYDTARAGARRPRVLRRRLAHADPTARQRAAVDAVHLIEIEPLPAWPDPPAGESELPRAAWRAGASSGDAARALDGDPGTHWTASVDPDAGGGWYEVDLGTETEFDRIRVELGAHYGEYVRAWRVWCDGRLVAARRYAPAPLLSYRVDHRRVAMDLALPPSRGRVLRIEVPPLRLPTRPGASQVPPEHWHWGRWGIHELRLFRRTRGALVGPSLLVVHHEVNALGASQPGQDSHDRNGAPARFRAGLPSAEPRRGQRSPDWHRHPARGSSRVLWLPAADVASNRCAVRRGGRVRDRHQPVAVDPPGVRVDLHRRDSLLAPGG
jgi:hypothetical protein